MKWETFLRKVQNWPLIQTEFLRIGVTDPGPLGVQISRWVKSRKLLPLRRGMYLLAEPYRKSPIFEPFLATVLKKPSYLSLEKALEYHGLIPESVTVYTSVTPARSWRFASPIGVFDYRHVQASLFWGYQAVTLHHQTAFIASPEKALLDFMYLNRFRITEGYLEEWRLQNVDRVNRKRLQEYARRFGSRKILEAAGMMARWMGRLRREEVRA